MVGHMPLEHGILVRIQVPQPKNRIAVFAKIRSVANEKKGGVRGEKVWDTFARPWTSVIRCEECTVSVRKETDKKWKGNFWFLLPRPEGADEARRLVLTRIVLEKSSDFVQETQPSFRIRFFAKMRSVAKRRDGCFRENCPRVFEIQQKMERKFLVLLRR